MSRPSRHVPGMLIGSGVQVSHCYATRVSMKCERCDNVGRRTCRDFARGGKIRELHLCEGCANCRGSRLRRPGGRAQVNRATAATRKNVHHFIQQWGRVRRTLGRELSKVKSWRSFSTAYATSEGRIIRQCSGASRRVSFLWSENRRGRGLGH